MKARLSICCGACGWAMCRVKEEDERPLAPVWCTSARCPEFHRQYEPPTVQLVPVHAKGK
jgi:hypothetical protein